MKKLVLCAVVATAFLSSAAAASPRTDVNFAFGGARTDSGNATAIFAPELAAPVAAAGLELIGLEQQLAFADESLDWVSKRRDVFYLSIGTNDFLSNPTLLGWLADPTAADPTQAIVPAFGVEESVARIVGAWENLYAQKRARWIVVPNLAPVGTVPLLGAFGLPPEVLADFNAATSLFNGLLAEAAAEFEATHYGAHIVIVDVEGIVNEIIAAGALDTTTPCNQIPPEFAPPTCEGFLFVDLVHPTTGVFALYAEAAAEALHAAGYCPWFGTRRVITFGDSLADTGSYNNVVLRATGTPGNPASQRYFEGRFTDGFTSIDYLEDLLGVWYPSTFFEQPASL